MKSNMPIRKTQNAFPKSTAPYKPETKAKYKRNSVMNNVNDIEERANQVSKYACFGPSALSMGDKISPVRAIMASRHASQRVVLINPEFPMLYTGAENEFGERSSWNIRVGNDEERKNGDTFEFMKSFKKFNLMECIAIKKY